MVSKWRSHASCRASITCQSLGASPRFFATEVGQLFGAMAKSGGEVGFIDAPWFNGGLFEDAAALQLDETDIELLIRAAKQDWAEIDPLAHCLSAVLIPINAANSAHITPTEPRSRC